MCFPKESPEQNKSKDLLLEYYTKDNSINIKHLAKQDELDLQSNGLFNTDDMGVRQPKREGSTQVDDYTENEMFKDFSVYSANVYGSLYSNQEDTDSRYTL